MIRRTLLLVSIINLLAGCASITRESSRAPRPALINHVVFVSLNDPADAPALIAACDARLATIPTASSYHAGQHVDTGRDAVIHDYDVGIFIGFDSLEDYAAYVDHPQHVALVSDWRPKIKALIVRDVQDETE